jgi:hypothetical protein
MPTEREIYIAELFQWVHTMELWGDISCDKCHVLTHDKCHAFSVISNYKKDRPM